MIPDEKARRDFSGRAFLQCRLFLSKILLNLQLELSTGSGCSRLEP